MTGDPEAQWVMVQGVLRHWTVRLENGQCIDPFVARLPELPIEDNRLDVALIQSPGLSMEALYCLTRRVTECLCPGGQLIIAEEAPWRQRFRSARCMFLFQRLGLIDIRLIPLTGKIRRVPAAVRHPSVAWIAAMATGRYALSGFRPKNTARPLRLDKARKLTKPIMGTTATVRGIAARGNKGSM